MVEQQRQQIAHAKRPPNSPQFTTKVFTKITPDPDLRLQTSLQDTVIYTTSRKERYKVDNFSPKKTAMMIVPALTQDCFLRKSLVEGYVDFLQVSAQIPFSLKGPVFKLSKVYVYHRCLCVIFDQTTMAQ